MKKFLILLMAALPILAVAQEKKVKKLDVHLKNYPYPLTEKVRETLGLFEVLGEKTQERIPDARLVELEGIGHLPHIESFDEFIAPLLEFLDE